MVITRHPAAAHRYPVLYIAGGIGLGTILSGIGTAVSVVGALQQGRAQEEAGLAEQQRANLQAQISRERAESERQVSAGEARQFDREQSALRARQRAVRAGSGVVPTAGSSLLVDQDVAREIALNRAIIEAGGEIRGTRLEQEAALLGLKGDTAAEAGEAARKGSFFKAGATALTGAADIFK